MKTYPQLPSLLSFIQEGSIFVVVGHKEPDGDCVGSQLALASVLRRLGKETILCNEGPFKRPEVIPYETYFSATLPPAGVEDLRVIVVDCSSLERTGTLMDSLKPYPLAVVDHHATGKPEGTVIFLDPTAPSVTFLVLHIIEALGLTPTKEEAELLLFGLCTDTGFFRHLDVGSEETFLAVARLVQAGASPKKIFQWINGGKSLDSRFLLGRLLLRTQSYYGGKLLVSYETLEDSQEFGLEGRDSDMLYQLLQSVRGVEAIAVLRQESAETCTVGLRSRDSIDVSRIAALFGGGGHRQAAGFLAQATIPELKERLIAAFGAFFEGPPPVPSE
ncbi:MAG TPA: bifunctional oligoribonuclease/PAP phosphatase NrnA [Termitinemataceae bacterium]|nr:bifunctional oligoribonuclease/PAP phosphatase NrnA [Termitinemataceae bacterium]HOM22772.1 bifunctional oligoribonuclease/PAP phosphatase NrnA [Termitinemataceae bacterium]HPQ00682.1 bifunctional oligoribonuclease/PAP phosphatase NrnA [Termitinemataceae bacterium]